MFPDMTESEEGSGNDVWQAKQRLQRVKREKWTQAFSLACNFCHPDNSEFTV